MGNLLIMILFIGSIYGFIKLAEDIARLIYGIVERTKRKKAEKELEEALDDIIRVFIEHEETQQDERRNKMYSKKTASKIKRMIEKECQRISLTELCEFYGVSTEDFDSFLCAGMRAAKKEEE